MAIVTKQDSNATGLRIAAEQSYGVLPGTPDWIEQEPNSYGDLGEAVTTVPRTPITDDRQRRKGVVTDLESSAAFNADLTQESLPDIIEGFLFADMRVKDELAIATVNTGGVTDDFEPASGGDAYVADDLLFAQGFDDAANNGIFTVTGAPTATEIIVNATLVETTGQSGTIRRCGFAFSTGDLEVDASGTLPQLTTTTKNLMDLGLIPGEWIWIGGDAAGERFAGTATNNTFMRVRSVTANAIIIDKADATLVTDNGAGQTVHMYFAPRIIKNESDPTLILKKSYQIERTLGAPDDASPAQIQAEYIVGCIASELTMNVATADKINLDVSYVGKSKEEIDGPTSLKSGNRPDAVGGSAFNTSSDFSRLKLAAVSDTDENPSQSFAFVQEVSLALNNNVSLNKAIGEIGACGVTAGAFDISGSMTAYFANVATLDLVRNNTSLTFDMHLVKENKGISVDIPVIVLGEGSLTVDADAPILAPLTFNASTGRSLNAGLDHTMMMQFWDYLPTLADF